jgi:hypothetical protein
LSSFWFIRLKQHWTIEQISIFSNSSHLEWRAGLSDTILKGTHQRTIPARFGLSWLGGFRGKDLNVIFYQNMTNLHNLNKSAERKISQKSPEYMLNYSLPCSCSLNLSSFWFILKQQFHQSLVQIGPMVSEELIKVWKVNGRMTDDRWRTLSGDNSCIKIRQKINVNLLFLAVSAIYFGGRGRRI